MSSGRPRRAAALTAAALISLSTLSSMAGGVTSAGADPGYTAISQQHQYIGVGSDTMQDLFNAFAGEEPTAGPEPSEAPYLAQHLYTPLVTTNNKAGGEGLVSFDATNPHVNYPGTSDAGDFITARLGGATFDRPNGSTDGRAALDASINSTTWGNSNGPAQPVGGQIDFVRASSLGNETIGTTPTGDLSAIPFAADGVAYAYRCASAPGSADCNAVA